MRPDERPPPTFRREPFPYFVADGFFPADLVQAACDAWPAASWGQWLAYGNALESKRTCNVWASFPVPVRLLLGELLMMPVWQWLGLAQAIPDTLLFGGGMHDMRGGDHLGVHLDHDRHALTGLERVCNAILFLGDDWQEGWGGRLGLWDEGLARPAVSIEPRPGRLACFATGDLSYHGVERLFYPPGRARKTLALYWYTSPRGEGKRPRACFVVTAGEADDPALEALRRWRAELTGDSPHPRPAVRDSSKR